MCGIVGVFSREGASVDPDGVVAMRDTMVHRGPDDAGLWRREPLGDLVLAHRRLAIVDLTPGGRQPMANEDGTVQVTFNGEIYNHAELRADLERRGHRFRSRSDTEVLVHLYEEHGAAMVERLVGMFAFGIWDERRQTLLLARDRLGIKPVYWLDDGRRFAFASEIKALVPMMPRLDIDETALMHYLTFVAVPPPRTLFAGVSKLAPGSTMTVSRNGSGRVVRYWDPLENRLRVDVGARADWESELQARLERSIKRRMMSDVPVGVFLSGGVDSSTNVALMSQLVDGQVNTFSIGFTGTSDYDELGWARMVADRFGTKHHEVRIDADDLWNFLPDLVHHQDEPIADPVCVPLHFVSRLAKENGVTVVHVGEGADEILAGYPTYLTAERMTTRFWRPFRAVPSPARRVLAHAGAGLLRAAPRLEIHREALLRATTDRAHLWWGGAVAFYEDGANRITTPALRQRALGETPAQVVASIAADADRAGVHGVIDRIIYQDLRLRLPELLLMRVDKLTMANGIEARVPFLDHELVELAMAIPSHEKVRDGVGKHILKRIVSPLLPRDVVWRPKQGFGAPVAQWFRGPLADRLARDIAGSRFHELGYLKRDRIDDLLRLHRSGRADRSFQLWNLLNLCLWFDHWIAGKDTVS